jgi:fatty acid desaturase
MPALVAPVNRARNTSLEHQARIICRGDMSMSERDTSIDHADPDWFRQPTPREHRIAAALFIGFGIFFALLFLVQAGWWFRWIILGLGVISTVHGIRHALGSRRTRDAQP